jgi:hypothetical protein
MRSPHDLVALRLRNQKLLRGASLRAEEVVAWLGAVQAQDFAGARWALGQRARGSTDAGVLEAFDAGRILRTHVLRPTWHLVSPADIRFLQALTAPRVNAANASYYRKLELDSRTLAKSRRVFERALQGQNHRTRPELAAALARAGIPAAGLRLAYLIMEAELGALLCSGPLRGKQITYALLEERVPPTRPLSREEALGALTQRYFTSHGPATLRDYVWWSGLTVKEARAGLDLSRSTLGQETWGGLTCWFPASPGKAALASPLAHLLPNYDEFLIAYKDRGSARAPHLAERPAVLFDAYAHFMVIDGRLRGTWRVKPGKASVQVTVQPLHALDRAETDALEKPAARYGRFLGQAVTLIVS